MRVRRKSRSHHLPPPETVDGVEVEAVDVVVDVVVDGVEVEAVDVVVDVVVDGVEAGGEEGVEGVEELQTT